MKLQPLLAGMGLFIGVLLPLAASAARQQDEGFSDVPKTHWAYEAVTDLKRRGILIGYPPDTPRPTLQLKPSPIHHRPAPKSHAHKNSRK